MTNVSILGCGWLGYPLGMHLKDSGYHVKGSTTTSYKLKKIEAAGIKPYFIDLSPEFKGDPSFFNCETIIINIPPRNIEGDDQYHEKQLLSIKKQLITNKVAHVIFISSTAVYPDTNSVVTESDAQSTCTSRGGVSLLNMERIFTEEPSLQTTVIRFGGLYGPDRHPGRFLSGKKNLEGAENPVNMIHLDDCIEIITEVLKRHLWNETFNASSTLKATRKEFYQEAAAAMGLEPPHFSGASKPYKEVSSAKLIEALSYQFKH